MEYLKGYGVYVFGELAGGSNQFFIIFGNGGK